MRKTICVTMAFMAATSAVAQSTERRCGWVDNPTPANWWLEDRDGSWTLFSQGDLTMAGNGFMDLPEEAFQFGGEWVSLNDFNGYGHGCACVDGHLRKGAAVSVMAMEPLPLSRCEVDPALQQR